MLDNQTCLVTGSGKGIAAEIAVDFARDKADLILVCQLTEQLQAVANKCRAVGARSVEVRHVNLMDPAAVDALAAAVLDKHGKVDVLVNGAGMFEAQNMSAVTGDPTVYDKVVALNLTVPMRLTRRLAPKMVERKSGVIINLSGIYGDTRSPGFAAYAAANHGLQSWSRCCAMELKPYHVNVVCVQPNVSLPNLSRGVFDASLSLSLKDVAEACKSAS